MLDRVVVDFVKTFGQPGILLRVQPKMVKVDKDNPKSEQVQANDGEGNLKWTVTIAVSVQRYNKEADVNLDITVVSPTQPCAGLTKGQTVIAETLAMGIMKNEKTGYSTFFSAAAIKPVQIPPHSSQPPAQR